MKKKVVWLPYDMDTAIGINNDGQLVFDYRLEDIDTQAGGEPVFNGQASVIWKNIRAAFGDELKSMYQNLRSSGALSYDKVEQMFEEHQGKWPEAIFNEDAWFKYIDPFVSNSANYLYMLLGSKAEQRKWWLYNRFRYIDSKYIAGDARNDMIFLRPYAADDITVTPYADIYATVAWDARITQKRATRGTAITLECPYSTMNGNIVNIYSSSQLALIGDLSGLKVGQIDISNATRLQELKVGDSAVNYDNTNLYSLTFGANILLKTVDVRNCSGLGNTQMEGHTQTTVDLSGCSILENVYFDGTNIQGVMLPNGGVIKKLHLPGTITNLTILNQNAITELVIPSYANITTLRLENVPTIDTKAILNAMTANTRVRLIGFYWEAQSATEISNLLDKLDTMRGLDESGNNTEKAQVSGTIHIDSLTGAEIADFLGRYPYLTIAADHVSSTLTCKTWDGSETVQTITCLDGVPQSALPTPPARTATAQYTFTAAGWSMEQDASANDPNAALNVIADRTIYAAYSRTVNTYTVTWKDYDNTVLETDTGVPYGTVPTYDGQTPTKPNGDPASGWTPEVAGITGDTVYTAVYIPRYDATFVRASEDGGGTLYTVRVFEGDTPVYGGETPTTTQGDATEFMFSGWEPALAPITRDTTYTAQFQDRRAKTIQYLDGSLKKYESETNTTLSAYAFQYHNSLTSVKMPASGVLGSYAFKDCTKLQVVEFTSEDAITFGDGMFHISSGNSKLESLIIHSNTVAGSNSSSIISTTLIGKRFGAIYVPSNLVSAYRASSIWGKYIIASIDDYPLSEYSSISDSWAEIIANSNYATDYKLGDTKCIDLGAEGIIQMELVAFNTDNRADGNGKARMTWISRNVLNTTVKYYATSPSGTLRYDTSNVRSYVRGTIKPLLPEVVRNNIVEVTKVSAIYQDGAISNDGLSTTEDVWIPSSQEMRNSGETTGVTYTQFYSDNNSRIKYSPLGSRSVLAYCLRSVANNTSIITVTTTGANSMSVTTNSFRIAIGFCL